jgi:proteic killer suppression protein
LERRFLSGDARGVNAEHAVWLRIVLSALDAAESPTGLNLPGFRLHPLKGERKGQWAIRVSGNWRVVFEFEGSDIVNVDLVDHH